MVKNLEEDPLLATCILFYDLFKLTIITYIVMLCTLYSFKCIRKYHLLQTLILCIVVLSLFVYRDSIL